MFWRLATLVASNANVNSQQTTADDEAQQPVVRIKWWGRLNSKYICVVPSLGVLGDVLVP